MRPRDIALALFLLAGSPVGAASALPQRVEHAVATERVALDDGSFAYAWSFDVRRTVDAGRPFDLETVRFGNARIVAQGEAAIAQGDPQWGGLVGWSVTRPSVGPALESKGLARAVARVKRQLGPVAGTDDPLFDETIDLLAQVEALARWRSWVGLWQPDAARTGWWAVLGGGEAPSFTREPLPDGGERRTARYRLDAAGPPLAVPLGSAFWLALELRDPAHPLLQVATPLDVAVVEVATFAPGADWPSRVEVERRVGPDADGRRWTLRQEIMLEWRAEDAPAAPPLADDSPWIEQAEPAADAAGDRAPSFRLTRAPVYPDTSRAAKFSGEVMLRVAIDADGVPTAVEVQSTTGVPELDDAAVAAVREWRFWPRLAAGRAVPSEALVPVTYRLRDALAPAAGDVAR